ncbi:MULTISPECIES: Pycsar system effector family protein [Niastella]|uniref:HD domain-containing protein n=1 Tax=Niastella soli TaxID=2821487 RepID=A0ABS3Z0W0_9BACT|nr:Pycsar system effector family protein [Niastella soli]MBO9203806.1 HD domain-containing protein [Niastella soli]
MKITREIQQQAAEYVRVYLTDKLSQLYCYHNFQHTKNIINAINEIADGMRLNDQQRLILLVAGWFHDIGYVYEIEGHEQISARMAERFLKDKRVDAEDISMVKSCILATTYPQHPGSILEQVICDADLLHLGKKYFLQKAALIREEWSLTRKFTYTDEQWHSLNLEFISKHVFHTAYCRKNYDKRKYKNIVFLTKLLRENRKKQSLQVKKENDIELESEKNGREMKMERGVETFFRTTSHNHMQLSSMADTKAHILLTINSILISIVISVLTKKVDQSTYLVWPIALLLFVCLVTTVFAVLTTKPKLSKGIFTEEQVARGEANLMFFGNFHNMDLKTYDWGVKEIMNDRDYLYSSMTRDIYYLGKVLALKYRYLNIGYKVFMYGLIVSVVAYGICFICMR